MIFTVAVSVVDRPPDRADLYLRLSVVNQIACCVRFKGYLGFLTSGAGKKGAQDVLEPRLQMLAMTPPAGQG